MLNRLVLVKIRHTIFFRWKNLFSFLFLHHKKTIKKMGKSYQVCDFTKGRGMTTSQSNEHLRVASKGAYSRNLSGNFDPSREHLNFEITKGGRVIPVNKQESIPLRIRRNLKKRKINDPNEKYTNKKDREKYGRITTVNYIFEGSRERMREIAFGNQKVNWQKGGDNSHIVCQDDFKEWAQDVYNFVAEKFGEENIVAFVAHLDETTPHIHCTLLPIVNNKFNFTALLGTKNRSIDPDEGARKIRKVQDELYEKVNKRWGLERGEDIRETGAKHRTTEQYRRELAQHMEKLREMVSEDNRLIGTLSGENRKLSEENNSYVQEIAKLEKKAKAMRTMIQNLNMRLAVTDPDTPEYNEIIRKIQERENELEKTLKEIDRIAKEMDTVKDSINSHLKEIADTQERLKEVSQNSIAKEWKNMESECLRQFGFYDKSIGDLKNSFTPRQKDDFETLFNDSVIETLARCANETVAVSAAIFLGYLDQATSFAGSHGGGGGTAPESGWGRKKDEDDDSWMRRVALMGMNLMRPKGRKVSRGIGR